jgi:hypothetical protein
VADTDDPSRAVGANEEESQQSFVQLLPAIFEQMITSAPNDEERVKIAIDFGIHALGGYQCFPEILRYVDSMAENGEAGRAAFLRPYALMAYQTFIDRHTRKKIVGVEVEIHLEDNSIIHTYGQALNEGIAQWRAIKVTAVMLKGQAPENEHYLMEVELAKKLIAIFGESVITGPGLGTIKFYNTLVGRIDRYFGAGSFMKIVTLSDAGRWREVFQFIASVHATGARSGND